MMNDPGSAPLWLVTKPGPPSITTISARFGISPFSIMEGIIFAADDGTLVDQFIPKDGVGGLP